MIDYSYPLYRPPAEANSLIFQVTLGCSHNGCNFCSMYKDKHYKVRVKEEVFKEIDHLSSYYPDAMRVFLADGDALSTPTSYLLEILQYLKKSFKKLRRVSCYASSQNLLNKTKEELKELYENGLILVYYGIETGSDILLEKINKGVDSNQIIASLNKAKKANMKISATVILGLGSKELSSEHIKQTAKLISSIEINYLSTLQLGLEDGLKDKFIKEFNDFKFLEDEEILKEQISLLEQIEPKAKIIFRSNHASNAVHLAGNLPRDTKRLIEELDVALSYGQSAFVPKSYRGF